MAEPGAISDISEAAPQPAQMELVVAVSENDVIGRGNRLPWHMSTDLRRFKALTLGKRVLMGRKTYESIGRALPGRTNLVLTRKLGFTAPGCSVIETLDEARAAAGPALMVIGGADVYRQCVRYATRIHLTLVHARIEHGDAFFRDWREPQWCERFRERHEADERNDFAYSFVTLERST